MSKMAIREAVEVLRAHNQWRRGDDADALDPRVISRAIDAVIAHFEGLSAAAVAQAKALGEIGRRVRASAGGRARAKNLGKMQSVEG